MGNRFMDWIGWVVSGFVIGIFTFIYFDLGNNPICEDIKTFEQELMTSKTYNKHCTE